VSDLAEQVFYARYHQLPNPKHFSVRAVEKPDSPFARQSITPDCSETVAARLENRLKVNGRFGRRSCTGAWRRHWPKKVGLAAAKPKALADTALLLGLTGGKAITIEKENQALSEDLEGDFSNPAMHEEAAFSWAPSRCANIPATSMKSDLHFAG